VIRAEPDSFRKPVELVLEFREFFQPVTKAWCRSRSEAKAIPAANLAASIGDYLRVEKPKTVTR